MKKKEFIFDEYNTRGQLYKVFLKKNKITSLSPDLNYFFYDFFLKSFRVKSNKFIFNNYLNQYKNILVLMPSFFFKSQFFTNKFIFNNLILEHKIKGFFLYKKIYKNNFYKFNKLFYKKHLIGYNFFIIKSNINVYKNFYKNTEDKDFNSIGKIKFFLEKPFLYKISKNSFNLFFIFNIYLLKILEIYKVCFYLNLKNFL